MSYVRDLLSGEEKQIVFETFQSDKGAFLPFLKWQLQSPINVKDSVSFSTNITKAYKHSSTSTVHSKI